MSIRVSRKAGMALLMSLLIVLALVPPLAPVYAADGVMNWSSTAFTESGSNDGSIANVINITLDQDDAPVKFQQSEDYVTDGLAVVRNLPAGLTCVIKPQDSGHCRITLSGQATNHAAADSIANLDIEFLNGAFNNGNAAAVTNSRRTNISITFSGEGVAAVEAEMNWGGTAFNEAAADDGSIGNAISISLRQRVPDFAGFEQSTDMVADGMARVDNLPAGLECLIETTDQAHCTITLNGQAAHHTAADSINNLTIEFLDGAFVNGDASMVEGSSRNNISIVFTGGSEDGPVEPPPSGENRVATFVVGSPSYYVNGAQYPMDVAPFIQNDRTLVPIRYLAYALGLNEGDVNWNEANQTVTLSENGFNMILQVGNPWMNVDGDSQLMDVSPLIRQERTFLPARWVAEAFGATVEWREDTQTVVVTRHG